VTGSGARGWAVRGGCQAVPVIYGETARGTRLLPQLTAGQGLGLLGTGALSWILSHLQAAPAVRIAAAAAAACGGTAYVVGRWPPGPSGQRLAAWLPRLVRHALRRRALHGVAVPGWDGLVEVTARYLRHREGWASVFECAGGDAGLRGEGAVEAARAAYRELLHSLDAPLEVVGISRYVGEEDRPWAWGATPAPGALSRVAQMYADYWREVVAARRAVVRRVLLVLTAPGPGARLPAQLGAAEAMLVHAGTRLGLVLRPVVGRELGALLRSCGGAWDPTPADPAEQAAWRVRLHDGA
jgi:hypothetical protein